MTASPAPLITISEVQRTQALEHIAIIHPALGEGVCQAQVVHTYQMAPCKGQQSM